MKKSGVNKNKEKIDHSKKTIKIERIQTGIRLEKKLVKVLKGLAEYQDISLGELIEVISLHSLERVHAFSPDSLGLVKKMKEVYGLSYDVHAYESFVENK